MRKSKYVLLLVSILALASGFVMLKNHLLMGAGIPYIFLGLGVCLFGTTTGDIYKEWALNKTPEMKKQQEIEEKDERNIQIKEKAKSKGFDMVNYTLAPLMLAYAYMNESFRVIIPLVVVFVLIEFYTIYWRVKLDKQM